MSKLVFILALAVGLFANDIILKSSNKSVEATMNKLQNIVSKKGFTVFAVVDHQAGATKVRMKLPPSKEIIFGNPKMGTMLMQEKMEVGLDLPIRILVFEDKELNTKIAYRDGAWLNAEHNLTSQKLLNKMDFILDNITTEAGR
ncbi:MAG: DUF302 domain-containing protein [Helicobacteraceae bacterium]|nr:DUF302 domain-containing protein [Helicobacteraceae bacterium]